MKCPYYIAVFLLGAGAWFGAMADAGKSVDANGLILLDLVASGSQFIAVGEGGSVLRSNDEGLSWSAVHAPTTRTLTGIAFVDNKIAVAGGRSGHCLCELDDLCELRRGEVFFCQ